MVRCRAHRRVVGPKVRCALWLSPQSAQCEASDPTDHQLPLGIVQLDKFVDAEAMHACLKY